MLTVLLLGPIGIAFVTALIAITCLGLISSRTAIPMAVFSEEGRPPKPRPRPERPPLYDPCLDAWFAERSP